MKIKLYNLLLNIKNSQISNKMFILQRNYKLYKAILNLLWDNNYILYYNLFNNKLKVCIRYYSLKPIIKFLGIISKLSRTIFFTIKQLYKLNFDMFFVILTNFGFKCLVDCKKMNLGGELLIIIY